MTRSCTILAMTAFHTGSISSGCSSRITSPHSSSTENTKPVLSRYIPATRPIAPACSGYVLFVNFTFWPKPNGGGDLIAVISSSVSVICGRPDKEAV